MLNQNVIYGGKKYESNEDVIAATKEYFDQLDEKLDLTENTLKNKTFWYFLIILFEYFKTRMNRSHLKSMHTTILEFLR